MHLIKEDNPNYKIVDKGASALSDVEALSIIMSGKDSIPKAQVIMSQCNYNFNEVARLSYFDMKKIGLSRTQAIRIIASTEYSRRKQKHDYPDKFQIKMSKDVADLLRPQLQDLPHEEFWVLLLNRSNRVIKSFMLSKGGTTGTVTDVKILLKIAIEYLAAGIILCHNHPSGNLNPSESDTNITKKIKESASLMDIQVLDHIIISEKAYFSFADDGLI